MKNVLLMMVVLMLAAGSASAALFTHYSFEEATGTAPVDSSGGTVASFSGAGAGAGLTQDTVNFREGSSSLYFDGVSSSVVSLDNAVNADRGLLGDDGGTEHDATIMFWMKAPAQAGPSRVLESAWGTMRLYIKPDLNGDTRIQGRYGYMGYAIGVLDDEWHHIALVIDQASNGGGTVDAVKCYVDGDLEFATGTALTQTGFCLGPDTFLGSWSESLAGTEVLFKGNLDDLRIYRDDLLTQGEIQTIMPEPATLVLLGLGGLMLRRRK